MRILVIGDSYSAKSFFEHFSKNEQNIVFSTILNNKNYVELTNSFDVVDFCEANDINLVLLLDERYINEGLQELLSSKNISAFSPSAETIALCAIKPIAKQFMHKNSILTPKFYIAQSAKNALDYIKTNRFPYAIRPETSSYKECAQFVETYKQAQKVVNDFFYSGNKKIVIEDYIEGKNVLIWTLSDGYSAHIIGTVAKYLNDVAYFNPLFINSELKQKIQNKIINPTINALNEQDEEYVGILGFDCILDKNNDVYLLGYQSFFDDLSADFFAKGYDLSWEEVFDSSIVGDVFLKYNFNENLNHMVAIRENDEIVFLSAKTKSNLKMYLNELGYSLEEYLEAEKLWKY